MLHLWFDPTFTIPRSAYLTLRPSRHPTTERQAYLALLEAAQAAADERRRVREWTKAST